MQEAFFSRLGEQLSGGLPFAAYRKPEGSGIVALLQQNAELHKEGALERPGFVFAGFRDPEDCILIPLEASERLELGAGELSFEKASEKAPESVTEADVTGNNISDSEVFSEDRAKQQHLALVERGIAVLKTGALEKVVLSRKEPIPLREQDPLQLFRELLITYLTAFVYLWYHPEVGLWLGATPETLLQVEGLNFKTMALAATQKYAGSLDVSWGAKEKQEQQFVTDSIVENLQGLQAVAEMKLTEPFTTRAGGLVHIRTDITGRLSSSENLKQIVHALHPTPAVCGLPKEKARDFILKEEGYDREYYTGFLGELNFRETRSRSRNRRNTENLAYAAVKRSSSLYVNLRCMKLSGGTAELFIGGGITKDSHAESEWQETQNKAQTMKKVILK